MVHLVSYSEDTMKLFKSVVFVLTVLVLPFIIFANSLAITKIAPKPTPQPIEVNSYELFWPIVAGRVQGDSMYSLKILKEKVRGRLIFSNLRKAEYNTVLSEKRLLEFEKLAITNKDFKNSAKTLETLKKTQEQVVNQLGQAKKEGLDVSLSSQTIAEAFDKEASLLQSILSKIEPSQKGIVTEAIANLASLSLKLK